jgi:hypothetical protein
MTLHSHDIREIILRNSHVPPKRRLNFGELHGAISQKIELFTITAVITSNPAERGVPKGLFCNFGKIHILLWTALSVCGRKSNLEVTVVIWLTSYVVPSAPPHMWWNNTTCPNYVISYTHPNNGSWKSLCLSRISINTRNILQKKASSFEKSQSLLCYCLSFWCYGLSLNRIPINIRNILPKKAGSFEKSQSLLRYC